MTSGKAIRGYICCTKMGKYVIFVADTRTRSTLIINPLEVRSRPPVGGEQFYLKGSGLPLKESEANLMLEAFYVVYDTTDIDIKETSPN